MVVLVLVEIDKWIIWLLYFILIDLDGFRTEGCPCLDACEVHTYDSDLSYAALSSHSVDHLLTGDSWLKFFITLRYSCLVLQSSLLNEIQWVYIKVLTG